MSNKLRVFTDHTEALMARDYLENEGIRCQISGVREYTSVVMGGDFGQYQIEVSPEDFARASQLLTAKDLESQASLDTLTTKSPQFYLRRAVMYAICALVVIPIIGNYISIRQLWFYVKMRPRQVSTPLIVAGVSLLQIPGLIVGIYILKAGVEYFVQGPLPYGDF